MRKEIFVTMTKQQFIRKFQFDKFDYDYDNHIINLGKDIYCLILEDPKGVMSFFIHSEKSEENVELKFQYSTETIFNISDISGNYRDRDMYMAIYSILSTIELTKYDSFSMEHLYKFGWLIDMAMFKPMLTDEERRASHGN